MIQAVSAIRRIFGNAVSLRVGGWGGLDGGGWVAPTLASGNNPCSFEHFFFDFLLSPIFYLLNSKK